MRRLITLVLTLLVAIPATAQFVTGSEYSVNNLSHQSEPSTGKDNLINVNLVSGTATASIPIYNYSIDGIDAGVSLSYGTQGIKVDQTASVVGLGWDLNAGGKITRVVNGIEDDITLHTMEGKFASSAFSTETDSDDYDLYTASFCGRSIEFSMTKSGINGNGALMATQVRTYPKSNITVDLFMTTASGDFMGFNNSVSGDYLGLPWVMPANNNAVSSLSLGIKITDERGNQFYFVRGDVQEKWFKTFSTPTQYVQYFPCTNWVLSRIITFSGSEIRYTYEQAEVRYVQYHEQQTSENQRGDFTWQDRYYPQTLVMDVDSDVTYHGWVQFLSQIDYPNGTNVYLTRSLIARKDMDGMRTLEKIKVHSQYDDQVYKDLYYKFNYSYFNTPYTISILGVSKGTNATEIPFSNTSYQVTHQGLSAQTVNLLTRLKLNSIDLIGTDNQSTESYYSFDYNTTPLPARTSPSQDCFGYYNGESPTYSYIGGGGSTSTKDDNATLAAGPANIRIPLHTCSLKYDNRVNAITYGVDRTPNIAYKVAGLLTKITNGKKGSYSLYYKEHSAVNAQNNTSGVDSSGNEGYSPDPDRDYQDAQDGVCIDKIVRSDGFNIDNTTTTQYQYNSCERLFKGCWFWYPSFLKVKWVASGPNQSTVTPTEHEIINRVYSNYMVSDMTKLNGVNHVYTDVTVKSLNSANTVTGSTRTKFSGLEYACGTAGRRNLLLYSQVLDHRENTKRFSRHRVGQPILENAYDPFGNLLSSTQTSYYDKECQTPTYIPPVPFNGGLGFKYLTNKYGDDDDIEPKTNFRGARAIMEDIDFWLPESVIKTTYLGGVVKGRSVTQYLNDGKGHITEQTTYDTVVGTIYNPTYNKYTDKYFYTTIGRSDTWNLNKGITKLEHTERWKSVNQSDYLVGYQAARLDTQVVFNGMWTSVSNAYNEVPTRSPYLGTTTRYNLTSQKTLATDHPLSTTEYSNSGNGQSYLRTAKEITSRDGYGNVTESLVDGITYNSSLWHSRIGAKVADISNARLTDVAYTSFEAHVFIQGAADDNKGNWDFDRNNIHLGSTSLSTKPITGRYYYTLPAYGFSNNSGNYNVNNANVISSRYNLAAGKAYTLTFWATAAPVIAYQLAALNPVSPTFVKQVNGWKLYKATIIGDNAKVLIGCAGSASVDIDEIRLCPVSAVMTTTTYEPLFGPGSQTDNLGNITYFEYDNFGRLKVTRDINNNILSVQKSFTQDADN